MYWELLLQSLNITNRQQRMDYPQPTRTTHIFKRKSQVTLTTLSAQVDLLFLFWESVKTVKKCYPKILDFANKTKIIKTYVRKQNPQ